MSPTYIPPYIQTHTPVEVDKTYTAAPPYMRSQSNTLIFLTHLDAPNPTLNISSPLHTQSKK